MNKKNSLMSNIFTESDVCELGITFMESGRKFSYDFKYDTKKEEYIYESFSEIFKDQYNNEKEIYWLKKDTISEIYECVDKDVLAMIPVVSKNNLLCYVIDASKFEHKVSKFLSQFEHNWVLYCPHSKEKGQYPERKDLYVR